MTSSPGISLRSIARCFEGLVPAAVASLAPEGTPNVTHVSQVWLVDDSHVALSNQFLNKTRRNVDATGTVAVLLTDPDDGTQYALDLQFARRDIDGPVFDELSASIEAIASMTGMQGVFRLRSADVFRVTACRRVGA